MYVLQLYGTVGIPYNRMYMLEAGIHTNNGYRRYNKRGFLSNLKKSI